MPQRSPLLNLRNIEVFRAVMRLGTVTAAAGALATSQPTITRELLRLEGQLGFALFERKRRRLHPTARARRLYHQIQTTFARLEDVNRFVERMRWAHEEVLTIATLPAFATSLLPEVLPDLRAKIPGLSVEIQTTDPIDETPVTGYDFDIGLIEGGFANPAVEVTTIASLALVVVMPATHPMAKRGQIGAQDLEGQDIVELGAHDPSRLLLSRVLVDAGVQRRNFVSCQTAAGVCELVAAGMGVAVINPLTALRYEGRGVVMRPFLPQLPFRISALRPLDRPRIEASDTLLALLKARCQKLDTELTERIGT